MKREIANVYYWQNGMAIVSDQFGEQMPKYQGLTTEVKDKIEKDAPKAAMFRRNASWPG